MQIKYQTLQMAFLTVVAVSDMNSALAASTADESANFKVGKASYASGDIKGALHYLDLELAKNPNNAVAHYYKAGALVKLNQVDEAKLEYKRAYSLQPEGALAKFCQTAIGQLQAAEQGPAMRNNFKTIAGKPNNDDTELDAINSLSHRLNREVGPFVYQDPFRTFGRPEKLNGFSSSPLSRYKLISADPKTATVVVQTVDGKMLTMSQSKYDEILAEDLSSSQSMEQTRAPYEERHEHRMHRRGSWRQPQFDSWAGRSDPQRIKSSLINESAAGIASQIIQPVVRSGIKLDPVGSDLYVRNYITEGETYAPDAIPLRATALKLRVDMPPEKNSWSKATLK